MITSDSQIHPVTGNLKISCVGFKLTPALENKLRSSLERLMRLDARIIRIRAKLRLFENGPRRDSFQVRMRLEQRGPDLVSVKKGHDLYALIGETADTLVKRLKQHASKNTRIKRQRCFPAQLTSHA